MRATEAKRDCAMAETEMKAVRKARERIWGLTFDLSGVPKARPLEGRVRPQTRMPHDLDWRSLFLKHGALEADGNVQLMLHEHLEQAAKKDEHKSEGNDDYKEQNQYPLKVQVSNLVHQHINARWRLP